MHLAIRHLRQNALVAHVAPLLVFVLLTSLAGFFKIENAALPWYRQGPEHWVYPLQTTVCGALLLAWWRHYTFAPWRGLGLAVLFGLIGIVVWIAPNVFVRLSSTHQSWEGVWEWLGFIDRTDGFDPTLLNAHPLGKELSIAMRFVRMVVVVPLVE